MRLLKVAGEAETNEVDGDGAAPWPPLPCLPPLTVAPSRNLQPRKIPNMTNPPNHGRLNPAYKWDGEKDVQRTRRRMILVLSKKGSTVDEKDSGRRPRAQLYLASSKT